MSITKLFDSHTHVQFAAFNEDREAVIKRALEKGVWLVNVGTQRDTSIKAVELANHYPEGVWATVGLHPIHTEKTFHDEQELGLPPASSDIALVAEALAKDRGGFTSRQEIFDNGYYLHLALEPKVVAVGECGLDYYRLGEGTKKIQKEVFIKQIELAFVVKKPLMIHCRQAYSDLLRILHAHSKILNSPPGITHFFSGDKEEAKKLLGMGFYFSFGGVITFTKDYDEVVKYIPLEKILLETDAPYVPPTPYRGKRNEPVYVAEVAARLAELKNISLEEAAAQTTENAQKIFSL